ncbi:pilus assembly protein PapD [[Pantoea] beijingensis]|uniref:Pilus assembly protein PapD n=1 Tax=[Pantoea] beijingensis TaxID=1324864 RepID=A0A443IAL2_9GAMM|nr:MULTISPECIES: fimbria/pilus periplasmic chaperone [Erwiniaceae]RWR00937.1 pilus assembly protein PapD [[Pantoea] beijingensis]
MKKFAWIFNIISVFALCLASATSYASIIISGTRVIYPSDAKEVTVKLSNVGSNPVLIQSWIDTGDVEAKPDSIKVPFIITPPMNRVDPAKGQTLRISSTATSLPADRESVFWLNVLEIPAKKQAKTTENLLQLAFRSRIKLFYRPTGLQGNANDAGTELTWQAVSGGVKATNPTPYYVSLVTISANGKQAEGEMVAPKSTRTFKLAASSGSKISGEFVNDYGAINKFESTIK